MAYISFISDEHLMYCIEELYKSYEKAKYDFDINRFYHNQIDPFKLTFDMKFFGMSPNEIIDSEIRRKIDKTISNAIGTFHENLISGIDGYKRFPNGYGYDIADENQCRLFADIKNKHNTVKGSNLKDLFINLQSYIQGKEGATAYWVQIISDGSSFDIPFEIPSHGLYNPNVRKISADMFYAILTGKNNAFWELCQALPKAIDDFLFQKNQIKSGETNSIQKELKLKCQNNNRTFEEQLMYDTFYQYNGFHE